jgi:mono/diheme cytochrome c family protein
MISISLLSCKTDQEIKYEQYVITGKTLYQNNCANCHGNNGEGLRKLYPSLNTSPRLQDIEYLSCLIKQGTSEKEINMPGNKDLYDLDIAQIITFMNDAWGDKKQITETDDVRKAQCEVSF